MDTLLNKILQATHNGIAVFNQAQKLTYFNSVVNTIWNIPDGVLDPGLTIIEFFEILRERQVYPPHGDFEEFCNNLQNYFYDLKAPQINKLLLGNNKTYEENIIPYEHGIIILWEDTTKLMDTIYELNNYKNLYHRIINSLPLPVIIVASNGFIEGYNLLFCNFFKLDNNFLQQELHLVQLLKSLEGLHNNSSVTTHLAGLLLSRREFSYTLSLLNGSTIEISGFPLPNGNNFIIFRSTHLISPKLDFQAIKKSLKDLQTSLILDLDKLINTPINAIIGYADLLNEGYFGDLNSKQHQYIHKVIALAENIKNDLNYKAELTLYQDVNSLTMTEVDINEVIVNFMQQVKGQLKSKNINIRLNLVDNVTNIHTNLSALTKLVTLTLNYLIEHNLNNSEIEIIMKYPPLEIIFKDTSTQAMFSPLELNYRYDLILIFKNLELLNGTHKVLTKNRSHRILVYNFAS